MYKIREPFSVSWLNNSFQFTSSLYLLTLLSEEKRKRKLHIKFLLTLLYQSLLIHSVYHFLYMQIHEAF